MEEGYTIACVDAGVGPGSSMDESSFAAGSIAGIDVGVGVAVVACALLRRYMASRSSMYHSFVSTSMFDVSTVMIEKSNFPYFTASRSFSSSILMY
jgi:hypothetical protein